MKANIHDLLQPLLDFLPCRTPQAWLDYALAHLDDLLLDHAHCEKKAASVAMSMLQRYPWENDLVLAMSRLAREELRHFEKVLKLMHARGLQYRSLSGGRYGKSLHALVSSDEPKRLVDMLLIGAIIEARSCERFYALAPYLPEDLQKFYTGLLASEAKHFEIYLDLAKRHIDAAYIEHQLSLLLAAEQELIESPDEQFRFHSGVTVI